MEAGKLSRFMGKVGKPCLHCADTLTEATQSKGWPGACRTCHMALRKCAICGAGASAPKVSYRCADCHKKFMAYLSSPEGRAWVSSRGVSARKSAALQR